MGEIKTLIKLQYIDEGITKCFLFNDGMFMIVPDFNILYGIKTKNINELKKDIKKVKQLNEYIKSNFTIISYEEHGVKIEHNDSDILFKYSYIPLMHNEEKFEKGLLNLYFDKNIKSELNNIKDVNIILKNYKLEYSEYYDLLCKNISDDNLVFTSIKNFKYFLVSKK